MSSQSPDSFDYDLLVVGGGIIGCGIALEAAQRGLSTILIERGDFAAQTSSACFNIVHGGLRYLQHLDIARLRFSAREQTTLCRIAPHLTEPLPVLVPCYGFGKKGREALAIAMKLYELLATGRNVGLLPERLLGDGQLLSSEKALALAPGISSEGLRGAAVFYDAKMLSSERLTISVMRSAERAGAVCLNYTELLGAVEEPHPAGARLNRFRVFDHRTGKEREIYAKWAVNSTGPWREALSTALGVQPKKARLRKFVRASQLVVKGRAAEMAVAVDSPSKAETEVVAPKTRSYFLVPSGEQTWCGTYESTVYQGSPPKSANNDNFENTAKSLAGLSSPAWTTSLTESEKFLSELQKSYRWNGFTAANIDSHFGGYIPLQSRLAKDNEQFGTSEEEENLFDSRLVTFQQRSHDSSHKPHRAEGRDLIETAPLSSRSGKPLCNLIQVAGAKFTTFRGVAERVIDYIAQNSRLAEQALTVSPSKSATTALVGGEVQGLSPAAEQLSLHCFGDRNAGEGSDKGRISQRKRQELLSFYGSELISILESYRNRSDLLVPFESQLELTPLEVLHSFEAEKCASVCDLVFRRTNLGYSAALNLSNLRPIVGYIAHIFGWSEARVEDEFQALLREYALRAGAMG